MKAKDRHRIKLLEYLANPSNDFLSRQEMAETILKIKPRTMRNHFSGKELDEIEAESHAMRRKRFAPEMAKVDRALLRTAQKTGSAAECRLCYEKFEAWSQKKIQEITGKDGGPIETKTGLSPAAERKLMEIINGPDVSEK